MRANPACLILLLAALPTWGQTDNRLFVRPWVELEPLVRIEGGSIPSPLKKPNARCWKRPGFSSPAWCTAGLSTTPPRTAPAGLTESFTLTPIAQIQWGNARLKVVETETVDQKLWARASYTMDEAEAARRASWESSTAALSQGEGKASVMKGPEAKGLSFQDAVRDAIRNLLHGTYIDAPRQIIGDVVLWEDPESACALRRVPDHRQGEDHGPECRSL